ncbi:charged multivesicular body protein 6 [Echinococcus multilocularis]|uniref:Charged multivesicular body protein 6 n=1 Tax=Echinococcus multilocularis TaxID=6211 RepID=A0A087VY14_ECHMU|nr:charged multivesicular body protein 6 [Echinococcus multilocularis]
MDLVGNIEIFLTSNQRAGLRYRDFFVLLCRCMGTLFSRHKSRITEHDKAVLQLKQQRDELKRYARRINGSIEKDTATIKELVSRKQKQRALLLLKKKKYQEKLLEQSEQHLTTVEGLINDLEFAQVQVQVVESLRKGNEALKKLNDLMKLEDVEKILSDAQEAQDYQSELSALIAGNLTSRDDVEVEAELERLLASDVAGDLPAVPNHEVPRPSASSAGATGVKKPQSSADHHKHREATLVTG